MSERSVALLRGINVGGKNILPMATLREIFIAAGCTQVATYIQSGNVVFSPPGEGNRVGASASGPPVKSDLADVVKAQIALLGLHVPVVLRTCAEMQHTLANNPYLARAVEPDSMHVMFLEHPPTSDQVASLDRARSSPDEFVVVGRDIYLHLPNGAAKTKLTNAYFDSKLKTVSTQRNWRTVLQLAGMMRSHAE